MKKNTKDRAKWNREADKIRRSFVQENPHCWVCGKFGVQCHEICQGSARRLALKREENFLAVCSDCHASIHADKSVWPVARQAALAYLRGEYQMQDIIECCNELNTSLISETEVVGWLELRSEL